MTDDDATLQDIPPLDDLLSRPIGEFVDLSENEREVLDKLAHDGRLYPMVEMALANALETSIIPEGRELYLVRDARRAARVLARSLRADSPEVDAAVALYLFDRFGDLLDDPQDKQSARTSLGAGGGTGARARKMGRHLLAKLARAIPDGEAFTRAEALAHTDSDTRRRAQGTEG